jgi:hypothetical protein
MTRAALIALAALAALALGGCWHSKPGANTPRPAAPTGQAVSALVSGHEGKDRTVLAEADKIDAIAPEAKPHTDAQRAAVAAAPAAQIADITAAFQLAIKALEADNARLARENARLTKQLAAALDYVDRVLRIGGYALVALLTIAAVLSIPASKYLPWLGPKISLSLGAAAFALFCLVQAYEWTKAHPWATLVVGALILIAAALAYANAHHATPDRRNA